MGERRNYENELVSLFSSYASVVVSEMVVSQSSTIPIYICKNK